MSDPAPASPDRTAGLVVFGVLALLIAGLLGFGLLGPLLGMLGVGKGMQQMPPRMSAGSLFNMLPMIGFFAVMGIGSIQGRRWACAFLHGASWLWLIIGTGSFVMMCVSLPQMSRAMEAQSRGQVPPEVAGCIQIVMLVFMAIGYLVMPVAFLLFYRSPHVKATCERKDPVPRWTDRFSVRVLPLLLLTGLAASAMVGYAISGFGLPLFGTVLTGAGAGALSLLLGAALGLILRGLARLRRLAWSATLAFTAAMALSSIITFTRVDFYDLYAGTGLGGEQIEMMKAVMPRAWYALGCAGGAGLLIYQLWIRRDFRGVGDQSPRQTQADGTT